MNVPYLIDGHNLLYAIRGSGEEYQGMNEEIMCAVIGEYFSRIKDYGSLLFDGMGPIDKSYFHSFENLEVDFSGGDHEADDFIEDRIEGDSAPRRLVVVSTDRRLRLAASKRRCKSLSSYDFWVMVVKQLNRPEKRNVEPRGKRSGITDAETEGWMKFFGLK